MYSIDWAALRAMRPGARLKALTAVLNSVQNETKAERCRAVRECVDQTGSYRAASPHLGLTYARVRRLYLTGGEDDQ